MIYLIYLIALSLHIFCNEPQSINTVKSLATQQKLHTKKTWRQLIGIYSKHKFHNKSDIKSPSFFLSSEGHTNPKSELLATIDGYYSSISKDENMHPKCQFPARYLWLKKYLNLDAYPSEMPNCSNYKKWTDINQIYSVQLMFVDGYLSNPASFHGHLLLKFNTKNATLLNTTTNYGAIIANDNPIIYIIKGVFGGYDATYTDQQFYRYNHNYSNIEQRDIWAYTLNLNNEQRQFLAAHNWELLGKKFSYYFFRDNCAYRIGRLLELVMPDPVVPQNIPWTLPSQIIQNTTKSPNNVKEIDYIPSRETKFTQAYNMLSKGSKQVFHKIQSEQNFEHFANGTLNTKEKRSLLDAFIDYNQLQFSKTNHNLPYFNNILLTRLKLPASDESQLYDASSIHKFQNPGLIQPAITFTNNRPFTSLRLRASNYDILSADLGREPNNIMEMGDIKIKSNHDFITLDYLTLIQVFAINTPKNKLEKNAFAWKIHIGINKDPLSKQNVFFTTLGFGKSHNFQTLTMYGLLSVQIQSGQHSIIWQPTMGAIASFTPQIKTHASFIYHFHQSKSAPVLNIDTRYLISKNRDIQIKFKQSDNTQIEIGHGIYW